MQGASGIPLDDSQIIELYLSRDENAIKQTDVKYRKFLFKLAYNILHDESDCEECINDTYLGVWNAIPPTVPSSFAAFICAIARRCAIKRYHALSKKRAVPSEMTVSLSELEDIASDASTVEAEHETAALGELINCFVRSLSSRRRYIFISRYYFAEPIDRIASELMLSRSMINKELACIKIDLKQLLTSEGYSI